MERRYRSAEERRAEMQAEANAIGVTEDYISTLVDAFYGRIQKDEALGPIFERAVKGDWAPHLATMKRFWSSVALGTGAYEGRPVPAHAKHADIAPEHFERWLMLFRQTLEDTAPCPDAVDFFLERAARIGQSLKLALFGVPGVLSGAFEKSDT